MDLHDEITTDDFKNYIDDISRFIEHQQIETGKYFYDYEAESSEHRYEFRSIKNEN